MYRNRVRTFFEYTAAPAVFIAIFLTLCLILSLGNLLGSGLLISALIIIASVVFAFALITRILLEVSEHAVRVHSKYTYIEIGLKDVIVSTYAGSFMQNGQRVVLRELVVMPLSTFKSAEVVGFGTYRTLRFRTEAQAVRRYIGNSERLGYLFREGTFEFKEFFYQERGFTSNDTFIAPRCFGKIKDLEAIVTAVYAAKALFEKISPPEPYVFKEAEFVKKRRELQKELKRRGF
ncbi:MAG: hypothetical protein FWD35_00925 [Oscillospiraceae bacterium]|nr:hypothetical protein [Oscillospiraceae bacterium]